MTKQEVIDRLLPKAKELKAQFGLYIAMTLAQIINESAWLKSAPGNNFLGIKVPKDQIDTWPADKKQLIWTKEWVNGKFVKVQAWFVVYESLEACMDRYAKILLLPRYAQTLASKDWWSATNYVRLNGYATSPYYTEGLRSTILASKLWQYDWYHHWEDNIEANFTWKETGSNVFFKGKKYYNVIEPYKEYWDNAIKLATLLQKYRDYAKAPIVVERWFSIPEYNAFIGGAEHSQHLYALGADCNRPRTLTIGQFFGLVETSEAVGIGVGKNYLHVDRREGQRIIWYY